MEVLTDCLEHIREGSGLRSVNLRSQHLSSVTYPTATFAIFRSSPLSILNQHNDVLQIDHLDFDIDID